jgi:tungstate transport system substrate-binding protein
MKTPLTRTGLALATAALLATATLGATPSGPAQAADDKFITVASTTSTKNSGLLDHLLPTFQEETGIEVRVVAVGTGKALQQARDGDADVLLVHAKAREEKFVEEGYGVERFDVMYNDFVIVGPESDPADVGGMSDAVAALRKIAEAEATFASRGDDSGTHTKERNLWKDAGVDPTAASGEWYRETGSGMGPTLNTGIGMGAYVLTDRATWISFENKADYEVQVEGDPKLFNQYGVILVNPEKHPHVKADLGQTFVDWLLSDEGQRLIADYELNGQQLFFPNAKKGQS